MGVIVFFNLEDIEMIQGLFVGIVLLYSYFAPTLIAYKRNKVNALPIFLLNLFLGWTFIGWLAALIWSCTTGTAEQLREYHGSKVS